MLRMCKRVKHDCFTPGEIQSFLWGRDWLAREVFAQAVLRYEVNCLTRLWAGCFWQHEGDKLSDVCKCACCFWCACDFCLCIRDHQWLGVIEISSLSPKYKKLSGWGYRNTHNGSSVFAGAEEVQDQDGVRKHAVKWVQASESHFNDCLAWGVGHCHSNMLVVPVCMQRCEGLFWFVLH